MSSGHPTDDPAPREAGSRPAGRRLGAPYRFLWESSWNGLILQVALVTLLVLSALPPPEGLSPEGFRAIAIFITCFGLWITAALPYAVTGLLAISLISVLRVLPTTEAFALFGNTAVFFILGSFILAAALMKSGLSRRIAVLILLRFGGSPRRLLTGVFLIAWSLSLVMSQHAVAAVLFPVVMEILRGLEDKPERSPYAKVLLLALAWGAVIGGTGTLLGGARAPLAIGILRRLTGTEISFLDWTRAVFPVTLAMIPVALTVLSLLLRRGVSDVSAARERLGNDMSRMGSMSRKEKGIGLIFIVTVFCWTFLSHQIDLATTAILASVALFAFRLVSWGDTEEYINWGIVLMYGGAVALGTALSETGAAGWIAHNLLPWGAPSLLILGTLVLLAAILTEGMSGAAVVAFLLPIGIGFADTLAPATQIAYLIAVAAGLVYIFPTGAPPIAIIFSSRYLSVRDVLLPGAILHVVSWTVILLWVRYYWPLVGLP